MYVDEVPDNFRSGSWFSDWSTQSRRQERSSSTIWWRSSLNVGILSLSSERGRRLGKTSRNCVAWVWLRPRAEIDRQGDCLQTDTSSLLALTFPSRERVYSNQGHRNRNQQNSRFPLFSEMKRDVDMYTDFVRQCCVITWHDHVFRD